MTNKQVNKTTEVFESKNSNYSSTEVERALKVAEIEDLQDSVTKALKKAFQLGQTYWQQADSESFSQNKKADETQAKFYELEDETVAAIREALANHSGDANEMVAEPDTKAGELHAMKTELWKTEAQEPSRFKLVEHFVGRERRYSKALELACSYLADEQAKEIADAMPPPEELAEPEKQEPVAWMEDSIELYVSERPSNTYTIPLYAAPVSAKREWVELTDDEICIASEIDGSDEWFYTAIHKTIAAFKEKNK